MNPKQIEKWAATRAKGMRHFVLVRGVLGWGVPMFVIMTFVINKTSFGDVHKIVLSALIWAIGGLAFGYCMWKISERKYQKVK